MSTEQFNLFGGIGENQSAPKSSNAARESVRSRVSTMSIQIETISGEQAKRIIRIDEGQFSDAKAAEIKPSKLSKTISAFSNSDGGDLYIGIWEGPQPKKKREWRGFPSVEDANSHLDTFEQLFPLGSEYSYEFLRCDKHPGLVLHVQVHKSRDIKNATNGLPYIRRGAQDLPVDSAEKMKRLEYSKGVSSFENNLLDIPNGFVTESEVVKHFIENVVPTAEPEPWLTKQLFIRDGKPTVAAALVFADEPQALLPKRCGIKIYRYKTKDPVGFREVLAFQPITVEGCLYKQITEAVKKATEITESIPRLGQDDLEDIIYPPETLHEIITNAVLHRDYSVADDVHIRVFDNRIEVQSPGKLPAPVTVKNILKEREARNGGIVRMLNKFPEAPNQDVGEGLRTAFAAMHRLGLKEPQIVELDNDVLVVIRHEPLASPEEAIMDYLDQNDTIRNKQAREITHISEDHKVKNIFGKMVKAGMIEQVPGTKTGGIKYRKVKK